MEDYMFKRNFGLSNVKQPKNLALTFSLILISTALFCWIHLVESSTYYQRLNQSMAVLVCLILWTITEVKMMVAAFSNPGEFPKIVILLPDIPAT